ncbi:MAG: hypothetical protein ACLU95_03180 [Bacteroides stercoris]
MRIYAPYNSQAFDYKRRDKPPLFEAIEAIVSLGKVSALEAFCTLYDLSAPRYREMRLTYGVSPKPGYQSRYKNIEVEAIYSLVVNYPISSRWLITGRGKMLIE